MPIRKLVRDRTAHGYFGREVDMKLKSVLFVLVLLLLTATVCAAQSPMGFSPDAFYEIFSDFNAILEGPDSVYDRYNEELGDLITIDGYNILILLNYKDNDVNIVNLYISASDDESVSAGSSVFWATFYTLVCLSGTDFDTIDNAEVTSLFQDLLTKGTEFDYCGYYFDTTIEETEDGVAWLIWVTKSTETASPAS